LQIRNVKHRRAISPVLATVILIAITLIAAIAIAGFVFGLFGTFTSGQNMQLSTQACYASGSAGGHTLSSNSTVWFTLSGNLYVGGCILAITNTGGASGSITGCSIYGTAGTVGKMSAAHGATFTPATVTVPAGTTSAKPVYVGCEAGTGVTITVGAGVTGSLVVASGSPLAYSAIGT